MPNSQPLPVNTDRLSKLRDFWHLNAPKGGRYNRTRAIFITLFSVVLVGVGYYFWYVERQKQHFDEERFRALSQVAGQFDRVVSNFQRVYEVTPTAPVFTTDDQAGFSIDENAFVPYPLLFSRLPQGGRFSNYMLFDEATLHYQTLPFVLSGVPKHPQADSSLQGPYAQWLELGEQRYRMYVTCTRTHSYQGQALRLGALVPESYYQRATFQTNPLLALILSIVAGLVLISLPLFKIFLINEFEAFSIRDVIFSSLSVSVGAPLVLIVILSVWQYTEQQRSTAPKELVVLRDRVRSQLGNELKTMGSFLQQFDTTDIAYRDRLVREMHGATASTSEFAAFTYPVFNEVVWMNAEGKPNYLFSAYPPQAPPNDLSGRQYFQKIRDGKGWNGDSLGRPWYLESITSWVSGQQEAVMSMPSQKVNNEVVAVSAPMASMFNTLLPKNTGFAVVDQTGRVLFHSVSERNSEENFYVEVGELPALHRLITYYEPMGVQKTTYRGQAIHVTGAQLSNWPLFVLVYQADERNYAFVANIAWITLLVVVISVVIMFGMMLGNYLLHQRFSEYTSLRSDALGWLRPQQELLKKYRLITVFLGLVALAAMVFFAYHRNDSNAADLIGILLVAPTLVHLYQYRMLYLQERLSVDKKSVSYRLQLISRGLLIGGLFLAAWFFDVRGPETTNPYAWAIVMLVLMVINGAFLGTKGGQQASFRSFIFQNMYLLAICSGVAELLDTYSFLPLVGGLLLLGEVGYFLQGETKPSYLQLKGRLSTISMPSIRLHRHTGQPRFLFEHQVMMVIGNLVGVLLPAAVLFYQLNQLQDASRIKQEHLELRSTLAAKSEAVEPWLSQRPAPLQKRAYDFLQSRGVFIAGEYRYNPKKGTKGGAMADANLLHHLRDVLQDSTLPVEDMVIKEDRDLLEEQVGLVSREHKFARVLGQLLAFINYDTEAFKLAQKDSTVDGGIWQDGDKLTFSVRNAAELNGAQFSVSTQKTPYSLFGHWIDFLMISMVLVLLVCLLLLLRYLNWQFYGFKFSQLPMKLQPPKPAQLMTKGRPVRVLYITPPQSELLAQFGDDVPQVVLKELTSESFTGKALAITGLDDQLSAEESVRLVTLLGREVRDFQGNLFLVSNRYPSQIMADYTQLTQDEAKNTEAAVIWMEVLSQFQEIIYPLGPPRALLDRWEDEDCGLQSRLDAEYQSIPFLRRNHHHFELDNIKDEGQEEVRDALLPMISHGAYTYYSHLWHSLSSKEQFMLYDLAEDGIVNPRNTTPMLSLMAKGLVMWDEERDCLRMVNRSFAHFIADEVGEEEGKRIHQQMRNKGTWASIRWVIMILLIAVLGFVAISQPEFFEDVDAILALLAGLVTIVPTITSLFSNTGPGK